ncbi:hypothetical protein C5167_041565 [Papaver somniferum]|uniref:uncharacterized protein LOC113328347 n=1 Tax=Papaver somniferum TaxID=3469 RepID=UPI000E6F7C6F|nr:uncharacterized protein LOC113328347 [Papaver somniferum]RZC85382.1 hypothetical protein C5167_041565 [Papaver somniferum]
MLITTKTTNSPASDDELSLSIPILEIKTQYGHDFINISPPTNHDLIETRILSPRYSKNVTVIGGGGGVGLGIVAALDNFSCTVDGEKTVTKLTCGTNRSNPIAISTINKYTNGINPKGCEGLGSVEMATSTTGGATSVTRSVYCDGGIQNMRNQRLKKWRQVGVFYESPSPVFYNSSVVARDYPPSDFLSSCYLCRKKLHGKDIYMYRGEKAFCSTECRYKQIADDERKDKKRPRRRNEVSRSSFDISSSAGGSPYLEDHLFSPGIMAI